MTWHIVLLAHLDSVEMMEVNNLKKGSNTARAMNPTPALNRNRSQSTWFWCDWKGTIYIKFMVLVRGFDFFRLMSQLDSINSKPKPLVVCCVIDNQGKNNRPQLVISYIYDMILSLIFLCLHSMMICYMSKINPISKMN